MCDQASSKGSPQSLLQSHAFEPQAVGGDEYLGHRLAFSPRLRPRTSLDHNPKSHTDSVLVWLANSSPGSGRANQRLPMLLSGSSAHSALI